MTLRKFVALNFTMHVIVIGYQISMKSWNSIHIFDMTSRKFVALNFTMHVNMLSLLAINKNADFFFKFLFLQSLMGD